MLKYSMVPKRLLITLFSAVIIIIGSLLAIQFAKGYRPSRDGVVKGTGLLAANSFPNGAQVYLNGELATATDNTLNLTPGEYQVEIRKDGFQTWEKTLQVEQELVAQTNAALFPTAPSLSPLTFYGASKLTPSPDGERLAFIVASASSSLKNGVYILDLSNNLLSLQKGPKHIIRVTSASELKELQESQMVWAADNTSLMLATETSALLADPDRLQDWSSLTDVSTRRQLTVNEWIEEFSKRRQNRLRNFPLEVQRVASTSASFYISPDENMLLYTASVSSKLADNLLPQPIKAASTQVQTRAITPGNTYVYDAREDRNFLIATAPTIPTSNPTPTPSGKKKAAPTTLNETRNVATTKFLDSVRELNTQYSAATQNGWQWYPDSRRVLGIENNMIVLKEYDGQNLTPLYAGPRSSDLVYPWSNGSRIIFLANFTADPLSTPNMYAIGLK